MPAKRKLKSRLEIILAHSPQETLTADKVASASKARLTGEMGRGAVHHYREM
jgi:hypothetical protein